MNRMIFILLSAQLLAPLSSPINELFASSSSFSGRAYDESQMMDFTPSTQEEIDEYYGSIDTLTGDDLKEYLYEVISTDNYFLDYGTGTSNGVGKYYEITDRNWELSADIDPSTFVFGSEDDDDYYLHLLYSTGNDDTSTAYNNTVNTYEPNTDLDHIDYENEEVPNSYIQVDKEHVWAKSHGFEGDPTKGAGTDLHHLMAADHNTNQRHSNYCYGDVVDHDASSTTVIYCYLADGTTEVSGYLGYDYEGERVFEPLDEYKGDIARAILYMATRYGIDTGDNSKAEPYLILTDDKDMDDDNDNFIGVQHNLSEMLEWNESDPVDDYESLRNSLIYKNVQKNRNPYVDHPEWARRVFDESYVLTDDSSDLPSFSLNDSYDLHIGSPLTLDADPSDFDDYSTSYDEEFISFDNETFTITPLKEGETTFSITYTIDDETTSEEAVIDIKPAVTIETLDFDELTFMVGDTYTFPSLTYNNLFDSETITFHSTDEEVATVDSTGLITAVGEGSCRLQIIVDGDVDTTLTTIKLTVEENKRTEYIIIIVVCAVLLVAIIAIIWGIVKHTENKSSKDAANKNYTNKKRSTRKKGSKK